MLVFTCHWLNCNCSQAWLHPPTTNHTGRMVIHIHPQYRSCLSNFQGTTTPWWWQLLAEACWGKSKKYINKILPQSRRICWLFYIEWTTCLNMVKRTERQTSHLNTEATGCEFLSGPVWYVVLYIVVHPIFIFSSLFLRPLSRRGVSSVGQVVLPPRQQSPRSGKIYFFNEKKCSFSAIKEF
jgi:hypothetical protein